MCMYIYTNVYGLLFSFIQKQGVYTTFLETPAYLFLLWHLHHTRVSFVGIYLQTSAVIDGGNFPLGTERVKNQACVHVPVCNAHVCTYVCGQVGTAFQWNELVINYSTNNKIFS